jgi:predicted acylesterase/phospholipase RssA|tara:strand:- start:3498 stop:4397 length:900 start_codon:yes stop_codon:yes gene_type:complete
MVIQHIVLPGGGPNFPIIYGAIKKLEILKYWSKENIKSIHCTSGGTIVGFIILLYILGIDWDDIDNYFINRPWNNVYELSPEMLMNVYNDKGLINLSHFETTFKPLMRTVDLSLNTTLKELYEKTNIEFYLYVTNYTDMKLDVLTHKNHPHLKILTAIHISCALPPIIQPVFLDDNKMYIDGGIFANNPIKQALDTIDDKEHSNILGFTINYHEPMFEPITTQSNIFEYLSQLLSKLAWKCDSNENPNIDNSIIVTFKTTIKPDFWNKVINNNIFRAELIKSGEEYANIYLNYNTVETN